MDASLLFSWHLYSGRKQKQSDQRIGKNIRKDPGTGDLNSFPSEPGRALMVESERPERAWL